MPQRLPDFGRLVATLSEAAVRYVLIGGLAMRLQGCAHLTDDLDLCCARDNENLQTLALALTPHHPRLRGAPDDIPFLWDARTLKMGVNFTLTTDLGNVDILGYAAGVDSFEGLWSRAAILDLDGVQVRVASIEDLIAMKRAADRPQDRRHVAELEALRRLLEEETPE
ncbi:MAG TPA: DUF6036 family nucleotidyltransferase [Armatimonadota bacterium]|nr:DUF6036 family nucleotidyltransferase [Armatimonadota bacterium]